MPLLVPRPSGNLVHTLLDLRKRALRKGIWFSSLTPADRILVEMIGSYLKIVRNATLATVIARILGKLVCALRNSFMDRILSRGKPLAAAVAMKAYSFGNMQALEWPQDLNYVRYMGMMADPSRRSISVIRGGYI